MSAASAMMRVHVPVSTGSLCDKGSFNMNGLILLLTVIN